jgi:hypothetical protein
MQILEAVIESIGGETELQALFTRILERACELIGADERQWLSGRQPLECRRVHRIEREEDVRDCRQRDGSSSQERVHGEPVNALLACDNAVPHLLSDRQTLVAFRSCLDRLVPGGVLVISVRDYAGMIRRSPDVQPQAMLVEGNYCPLAVQEWEWDGDQYDVRLYLTEE